MPVFLNPKEFWADPFIASVPRIKNPDESIQHVYLEGARFHVISWSTMGRHCSELDCEVNREEQQK